MLTLLMEKEGNKPICTMVIVNGLREVYETVLSFAKNNGFYYGKYEQFGMEWFDIAWIDISNPAIVNKYGYKRI